ncbi:MAG: competence protein ComEC [Patescibacteria group bacterium]|jgi:competence protein ComEC|nr:competence protein ComEC [Patescibacteria group bacterium]
MTNRVASIVGIIGVVVFLVFSSVHFDSAVKIWVFDIGQGDAIFIDGPEKQILIDGGPDALVLERLSSVMPWWDRSIDMVLNTHPHADHLVGLLPVLERYKVDEVFDAGEGYNTPEFQEYVKLAGERREIIAAGDVIDLGGGATLTALWPSEPYHDVLLNDPNDGSLVELFQYGEKTMLLTGDAGIAEENGWDVGDIDILKVGHHGSDTSTSQEFVDRTTPEVAIISLGQDNDYGHPSSFVLDRLLRSGAAVYRTDEHGSVRIKILGDEYFIKTFAF